MLVPPDSGLKNPISENPICHGSFVTIGYFPLRWKVAFCTYEDGEQLAAHMRMWSGYPRPDRGLITSQFALTIYFTRARTLTETNPLYRIQKFITAFEKNQRIIHRFWKLFDGLRSDKIAEKCIPPLLNSLMKLSHKLHLRWHIIIKTCLYCQSSGLCKICKSA